MTQLSRFAYENLVKTYVYALRTAITPAVGEARTALDLSREINDFVFSAEGAISDAGIVVHDQEPLPKDLTSRLFVALDRFKDSERVLLIDFKSTGFSSQGSLGIKPRQRACELLIVNNTAVPDWVAVVPTYFVHRDNSVLHLRFRLTRLCGQDAEPFSDELTPFAMPRYPFLARSLRAYVDRCRDPSREWTNPFTGIVLSNGLPVPVLHDVNYLLPAPGSKIKDHGVQLKMWEAFREHSAVCRYERSMVQPGAGDFQLIYRHNGADIRVIVELKKRKCCRIGEDGKTIIHTIRGYQADDTKWCPRIFSPYSPWDYILTVIQGSPADHALFVCRDDLPDAWFNETDNEVSWRPSQDSLQTYIIPFDLEGDLRKFATSVIRSFKQRLAAGKSLKAVVDRPFVRFSPRELELLAGTEEHQAAYDVPTKDKSFCAAGVSHYRHNAMVEVLLRRQCRQRNFGWVYNRGFHPTASHVYVPLRWNDTPPFFESLSIESPCLYLNFAFLDICDEAIPRVRHWPPFHRIVKGRGDSLCILFPFKPEFLGRGLICYVVPSRAIRDDPGILRGVEQQLHRIGRSSEKAFRLSTKENVVIYSCREYDVTAVIEGVYREWSNPASTSFQMPGAYGASFLDDVITTRRECIERALDFASVDSVRDYMRNTIKTSQDKNNQGGVEEGVDHERQDREDEEDLF